jgi:hypothetical protein
MKLTIIAVFALLSLSAALSIPILKIPSRDLLSDLESAVTDVSSEAESIAQEAASEVDGVFWEGLGAMRHDGKMCVICVRM